MYSEAYKQFIHPENRKPPRRRRGRLALLCIGAAILLSSAVYKTADTQAHPRHHLREFEPLPPLIKWVYPNHLYTRGECEGAPKLRLYRRTADYPEMLRSGESIFEGDEVQLQYTTQQAYAVILSVDGRGVVSQHYPEQGTHSTRIKTGTHVLPFAFELDDAPGFEMFLILASDTPVPLSQILKNSREITSADESPAISGNIQIDKVVLHKLPRQVVRNQPSRK